MTARAGPPPATPLVAMAEVELTAALEPIALPEGVSSVRLLARLGGAPLGWAHMERPGTLLSVRQLRELLAKQLGNAVAPAAVRMKLDAQAQAAPPPDLSVSVVVCTRDRTESLARCLASLLLLQPAPTEIIVVDNAPTTRATERLVASSDDAFRARGIPLRYVHEPQPGLDWARNRGAREALHDIVAYTDDDVAVDSRWLAGLAAAFADSHVELVTGLVLPGALATEAQVVFEDAYGGMAKGFAPQRFAGASMTHPARLGAHHLGVGANMAMRREWLTALGGFDTALDVGTPSHGGGDIDMFYRTLRAGGVVRYEPTAIVRHWHREQLATLKRQLRDNGRAFGVYLLMRATRGDAPIRAVARYAVGTWVRWLVMRVVRRVLGREPLPLNLQAQEWAGLCTAGWAWRATLARDRKVRRQALRRGSAEAVPHDLHESPERTSG